MRIATFNANSIRARLDIVTDWLAAHDPDVLCIQETKVRDEEFPLTRFTDLGYHVTFRGQKSYNGVATISKQKPSKVLFGLDDSENADESRLAYTMINGVHIINTYVPQGRGIDNEMYPYKLEWFARLKTFFGTHFTTRMKVLWLGDINIAPGPLDIHNSEKQTNHVCYHKDARTAFNDTFNWGFTDIFRKHHTEPGCFTFYDYRFKHLVKENKGWRIDLMLGTKSLANKSTDSWIDLEPRKAERPSDHTFLVTDFDL